MKMLDYLYSKAVTLCFLAIGAVCLAIFMLSANVHLPLIGMAMGLLILLVAGWLLAGYRCALSRLRKLNQVTEGLSDPYLLGEVLPPPVGAVERQYYSIMKTVSRSAIGVAESAMREKEEYCEYVESWIHEIKTPLTACSLILDNGAEPRKLRRELKRADNLTETILYYARLRSAEKDIQIRELYVAPIMNEAVRSQTELLIAAGISVELEGDFAVHTDGKSLCFMLKQLLINCAKYCPGCHIALTAKRGAISVLDDGIGIPEHEIRRVTQRGFTGANGKRLGGGTGMGLYIVQGLCERLGIALTIESEEGSFTRVTFTFENLTKL